MTTRERALVAGLVFAGLVIAGLALFHYVRLQDARDAVREFVRLEQRLEHAPGALRSGADDEEGVAGEGVGAALVLARRARGEVRRHLLRGEFGAARRRLEALAAEASPAAGETPDAAGAGPGLGVDALWKPGSRERAAARETLRRLAEKQAQGYDVEPARAALARVADAARRGRREEALAAFAEVERALQIAALRPGFAPPAGPAAASAGAAAPPPPVGPEAARIEQILRLFQMEWPPQLVAQLPPAHRALLPRLRQFAAEASAAQRQGKDLRPLFPTLQRLGEALQAGRTARAARLLEEARAVLAAAPLLAAPGAPASLRPPQARPGEATPPVLPPAGGLVSPAFPAGPLSVPTGGETLLRLLDRLRAMPESEYRRERSRLGALLAGGAALPLPGPGSVFPAGGAALRVPAAGAPEGLRLRIVPDGALAGLEAGSMDLSPALPPGGFALVAENGEERPLRGPLRRAVGGNADEWLQEMRRPEGELVVRYRGEDRGLLVECEFRPAGPGQREGGFLLRLPLRAAGWRWIAGDREQVIAVDMADMEERAGADGLPPLLLRGAGIALRIEAPTGLAVAFEPLRSALVVRFPRAAGDGTGVHRLRLRRE